jgi:hypothetical protein
MKLLRVHESLGTGQRSLHRRSAKLLAACFVALIVLGTSGCVGVTSAKSNALVVTPNSVDFKGVLVGQKNTQTLQLSNVGSAAINVRQIQVTGAGFQVTPPALPLALAPGANQIFNLAFLPVATGSISGTLMISSDDPHSPASVTVLGMGEKISSHAVSLSWNASTSSVIGYFVYRGATSGGPYTRVTTSSLSGLTFTDSGLLTGATYYYVITAVDRAGAESVFSNQASVVMPNS